MVMKTLVLLVLFQGGFPGDSVVKNTPANAGDVGSIPRLGRSHGGGQPIPVCFTCKNPMDKGVWQTIVHEVSKSQTRLSD